MYVEMVKHNMVDCIVATGASIVDMDFFEALGFKHYRRMVVDDNVLRDNYIDRIYDTYIDEQELQNCDAGGCWPAGRGHQGWLCWPCAAVRRFARYATRDGGRPCSYGLCD